MKQLSTLLGLCLFCLLSCTKSLTDVPDSASSTEADKVAPLASLGVVDPTSEWFGRYLYQSPADSTYDGDPDGTFATEYQEELIQNGTAKVKVADTSLIVSTTSIVYDIPYGKNILSDSIVFEGNIRNSINTASMSMTDYQNIAQVNFSVPQGNTMACQVYVGQSGKSFTISPAIDFTSYKLVQLAIKGNKAFLIVNNKQLATFPISSSDHLGGITQLSLGSLGYLECDRVRLLNSYTKQVKMKEDFNINGQSHTIYY